jgi:23S rRNA (pseudouridine1915-N3)-methyltransferase
MKLHVIAVGMRMPEWVDAAWNEYAKRLPPDCSLALREIKPEPRSSGKTPAQLMKAEAKRIDAALPAHAHLVALDEHGKDVTTMQLAESLQAWRAGGGDVALLIGGPDGLDRDLQARCRQKIRLSSLTLPHPMVRVVLAEQLYRAWTITVSHPYHRA